MQRHHGVLLRAVLRQEDLPQEVPRAVPEQDMGGLLGQRRLHHGLRVLVLQVALRPSVDDVRPRGHNLRDSQALVHSGADVPAAFPPHHHRGAKWLRLRDRARHHRPDPVCSERALAGGDLHGAAPRHVPGALRVVRSPVWRLPVERDQARIRHQGLQQPHPRPRRHDGPLRLPVCDVPVHLRALQDVLLLADQRGLPAGQRLAAHLGAAAGVPTSVAGADCGAMIPRA
mmetsp:Transcript_64455/g.168735  ORF Transcript_64455/g.168735 Transcript_64455/m.168735 type:complete len:229 (+) Transcript_64455:701-1387(+)